MNDGEAAITGGVAIADDDRVWLTVLVLAAILVAVIALFVLWRWARRYVCLRRSDCCGKGCGCLFPVRRE